MTTKAGQRMRAVLTYIADHPGCSKAQAAQGADASYNSVQRVIRRGYVREAQPHPTAHYHLYLTEAGRQAAEAA